MKKLFLSAVAAMLAVTSFSQKIDIHVTGADVTVYTISNGNVIQDYPKPLNTTYSIDLSNNSMRWVCPAYNADESISIRSSVIDSVVIITYQANGLYQNIVVPVTFEINLKTNKIIWTKLDSEVDEKTVYEFSRFTLKQNLLNI
jgi:hypothetical protein